MTPDVQPAIAEFKFGDRELVIQWDPEEDGAAFIVRSIEDGSAVPVAAGSWRECCEFACVSIAAVLREAGW